MSKKKYTILCVEDSAHWRGFMCGYLQQDFPDVEVHFAETLYEARALMEKLPQLDAVISDMCYPIRAGEMPKTDSGYEMALRCCAKNVPCILMSSAGAGTLAADIKALGLDYHLKQNGFVPAMSASLRRILGQPAAVTATAMRTTITLDNV